MEELNKPRSAQVLTVDHVLEATAAASALRKREVVDDEGEDILRGAIIQKFQSGTIESTVDPRKLSRLARAVERKEVSLKVASRSVNRFIEQPGYSIDRLFNETVAKDDFRHSVEILVGRTSERLVEVKLKKIPLSSSLRASLENLADKIADILGG